MLQKLAVAALVLILGGCGGSEEEATELQAYVAKVQRLDEYNRRVADFIVRLYQPSHEITAEDLAQARRLVDDYIRAVEGVGGIQYDELRRAYNNYVRKLAQARDLAVDTGRELKQERGNMAIAMRHIEKVTRQHYESAIDLLWMRQGLPGDMPLKWPD